MDDAGNVLILWSQATAGIYFSYYDATLAQWTAPANFPGFQQGPHLSMTMLGDGRAIVATVVGGLGNNPDSIEAWIYDPVTDDWTITGPIETNANEDAAQPKVAVDGAGNVFVTWLQQPSPGFYDV